MIIVFSQIMGNNKKQQKTVCQQVAIQMPHEAMES